MKKVLVLICCVGLAGIAGAKQQKQNQQQVVKKGGNVQQSPKLQGAGKSAGQKFKQSNAGGNSNFKQNKFNQSNAGSNGNFKQNKFNQSNMQGGNKNFNKNKFKQSNMNSQASNTSFNKSKNVNINKNVNVNKNYKFQKFKLNKPMGKYQAIKFNQNFKFAGAQNWKGSKYIVFKNYHPMWQNKFWWGQHYSHITFVFGSPYYWDAGYWYPAWGYEPTAEYYYDGPIYASTPDYDPGEVVASVQTALQQEGYYQGEVDGVLGPETRAALAEYQSSQGLETTGAVDEPTLQTLGMG